MLHSFRQIIILAKLAKWMHGVNTSTYTQLHEWLLGMNMNTDKSNLPYSLYILILQLEDSKV